MLFAVQPLKNTLETEGSESGLARSSLAEVLKALPNGRNDFVSIARDSTSQIYSLLRDKDPTKIFLDKTPRYYRIIPELVEIHPNAKIIVLLRHPLAVLNSILKTWATPGYGSLRRHAQDLFLAPRLLLDAIQTGNRNIHVLRYESLLSDPEPVVRNLCAWLDIQFQPSMLTYGKAHRERWASGDQQKVYARDDIDQDNAYRWKQDLGQWRQWRILREYADRLGADLFEALGYSWRECDQLLDHFKPTWHKRTLSVSLFSAVSTPYPHPIRKLIRSRVKRNLASLLRP